MSPITHQVPIATAVVQSGLLLQCAWCRRYRLTDGSYGFFEARHNAATSHGICPECTRQVLGEMPRGFE